mgnify:FL=1
MARRMYSTELKLEIIQKYEKGNISLHNLAREYHIDYSQIRRWKDAYLEHGVAGLSVFHGTYTGDFKVSVVEYMHNTGASARQTMAHFNIPSTQLVSKWERIYYEQGKEALYIDRRGRPKKMKDIKNNTFKKNTVDTNEDLLAEAQRLRMENAYFKKLNALIQEREKSEKKTK